MEVAHICHVFSAFETGGSEVRTVGIINRLGTAFRHTIVATDGSYGASSRLARDVDVRLLPPPTGKGGLLYGLAFRSWLRELRPSLLVTYNWGAIDAVIGARLASVCPIVHAEDGFGPEEAVRLKHRRVFTRAVVLRAIFATVVPSRTLLNIAHGQFRLPAERVRLIPNGVDLQRFRPCVNPEWRRQNHIPDTAVLVGFVGALRPEKRLDHLLKAAARSGLSNIWIGIVGDGPCRANLEALAESLGIRNRVVFSGAVRDPAAAYAAFDVFALSSMTEQMPISLLEAMATGLPALCTDVGDIRDMLGEAGAETVVPKDDLDLYAHAMTTLASSPDLRRALGQRNRVRCERHYSIDHMTDQYRDLYDAAVASWSSGDTAA